MDFLGLLAAVVGLIILMTLSIVELLAIPWPILLILLLATLWFSQRLLDQFNPVPVEGLKPSTSEKGKVTETPDLSQNARIYRGQSYTGEGSIAPGSQAPEEKCYRGLKDKHEKAVSPDLLANEKPPVLSYRGVKTR